MISRKVNAAGLIDLENHDNDIHHVLNEFRSIGYDAIIKGIGGLDNFEHYIVDYFYDGIS